MANGPNPSGKSHASHRVPNLHKLPVRATPRVHAKPNTVSQGGPRNGLNTTSLGGDKRPAHTD